MSLHSAGANVIAAMIAVDPSVVHFCPKLELQLLPRDYKERAHHSIKRLYRILLIVHKKYEIEINAI